VEGVGGGLRLTFRHNGTSHVLKDLSMASKPHYKVRNLKAGRPITIMHDWEQFHTMATLLKPTNIATVFSELCMAMKKSSGKADLAMYI